MTRTEWHDRKRYWWLLGLFIAALTFAAVGLNAATDWGVWLWLGPIVVLGLVPAVDLLVGVDLSNPPAEAIAGLEADRYYRWVTYLFLPVQYSGFLLSFWYLANAELTVTDRVGLAVTVGFIGGLGINTAHELGHKRDDVERWMAKVALAPAWYGHFYVEHNRGHHVRVATPEDPASSRLGESFYAFWPRTVSGSLRSAWRLERKRYSRRRQHPWRPDNDVLNAWLLSVVLWVIVLLWLGIGVLPYLVLQAVVAFTLLEAVNYLEHYGLLRQRVGVPGRERYERVEPRHSWNSNNVATNVLLYQLQRHSDHHANPTRRYQSLRDFPDAPVLPTGYAGMILLALVPPLWRRVMDRRVLAHYGGDVALANMAPRKRSGLLARYPAPRPEPVPASAAPAGATAGSRAAAEAPLPAATARAARAARAARCPGCGYVYEESVGAPREGFPAGTPWSAVPDSWCCPDCGVREKSDFVPVAEA